MMPEDIGKMLETGSKRRKVMGLLVNRALLKRYIFLMVVIMLVSSLLVGFVIQKTIEGALEEESSRAHRISVYDVLMEVNNTLLIRVFLIMFISVVVTGVAGILFLHRVAGPIYRIRGVLRGMAKGQLPKHEVTLREGDFFIEVAEELNSVIRYLRTKGM